jgi:hypothetical protein
LEPLRKTGGKSGRPVISMDGGKTWTYEDESPSADTAPKSPNVDMGGQVAPSAPRQFNQQPARPEDSLRDAGRNLYEGIRGIGSGLLMGADDEAAGGLQTGFENIRRNMGGAPLPGGNSTSQNMAAQAKDKHEGQEFSAAQNDAAGLEYLPSANTFGQIAGSAIGAKGVGAGVKAAGVGGNAAVRVGTSATGQGAIQGAADAQQGHRLEGAGTGAVTGAVLGKGAQLVGKGVSAAGRAVKRAIPQEMVASLQKGADKARVRALGLNPGQVMKEPGGVERQAAVARKYGVGKGLFTGRQGMEDQAAKGLEQASAGRAAIEQAVPENAVVSGQQVSNPLVARAKELDGVDQAARRRYLAQAKIMSTEPKVRRELVPDQPAPVQGGAATVPAGGAAIPAPARKFADVPYEAPREMNLAKLREGRQHYSPENWKNDSAPVRQKKDFRNAYAEGENALIERELPGKGAEYRGLGQDMHGLIEAQEGLANAGGAGARMPTSKFDAARQLGRSGWAANQAAKVREAAPGAARAVRGIGESMSGAADRAVNALGSEQGRQATSVLTRQVTSQIENAEYPEDEYFRQYMSNPDYRHSRR